VIGETVAGYRIVGRLGQGSTGEVFSAEHASVGTKVAIKILSPAVCTDPARVQRYLREAQAASRVGNQGTVKITDVGAPEGGSPFLVMELLEGETLAKRIARTKRMSTTQIGEIGRQLATVLAAMHDDNLIHRDLRPDKIFFVRHGGLAQERLKVLVGDSLLLGPTHDKGALYAAPELWNHPETADWRVDIYALGCMIFEMATGQPPYRGDLPQLAVHHSGPHIPTARSLMPDVPPNVDALIARLITADLNQRPKSMREVARELDSIGGTSKPLAPTIQDTPVLVLGEMEAGTLAPGPAHEPRPAAAPRQPAAPPQATAPRPDQTAPMKQAARSKLPLVIALVLAIVGVLAIVLATR